MSNILLGIRYTLQLFLLYEVYLGRRWALCLTFTLLGIRTELHGRAIVQLISACKAIAAYVDSQFSGGHR